MRRLFNRPGEYSCMIDKKLSANRAVIHLQKNTMNRIIFSVRESYLSRFIDHQGPLARCSLLSPASLIRAAFVQEGVDQVGANEMRAS